MKWIKKFEELDPSTYRSAGKKLIDKGHTERGFGLVDHSFDKEHGVSNMWFCNQGSGIITNKEKFYEPFSFSFDKSVLTYCVGDDNLEIETIGVDEYVDEYGSKMSFGFNIEFYFSPTSITTKKLKLDSLDSFKLFNLNFTIDGSENKKGDIKVTLNGKNYNLDHYKDYYGIFSDRKSANHFLRKILPNEIKKHTDDILNIFALTEISTTTYNDKVLDVSKKIKLNNLYRTEIPYSVERTNSRHYHFDDNQLYHYLFAKNDITK